jgi:hypothetical protein
MCHSSIGKLYFCLKERGAWYICHKEEGYFAFDYFHISANDSRCTYIYLLPSHGALLGVLVAGSPRGSGALSLEEGDEAAIVGQQAVYSSLAGIATHQVTPTGQ